MSDMPGCFGSILSCDKGRASCSVCILFERCEAACEEVRVKLIEDWSLAAELDGMENEIRKVKGQPHGEVVAAPDIEDEMDEEPEFDIERIEAIAERCQNKKGRHLIRKWAAMRFDLSKITRGYNPFPQSEPFAFAFVDQLLEQRGEGVMGDFIKRLEDELSWRRGTASSHCSMMKAALFSSSIIEIQGRHIRIRRTE